MTRESLRLQQAVQGEGVPAIILKGAPLAMLAYGDPGYKEALDIDLLVPPGGVRTTIGLLHEMGYESDFPRLSKAQVDGYLRHCKEATFVNRQCGVMIDLHWGLVDNPGALTGIDVEARGQSVAVPGGELRTLADEELFAYLCVHGSLHNWARLKWLADLGAFINRYDGDGIEKLYSAAEQHSAARAASIALALCGRVLGRGPGPTLRHRIKRDSLTLSLQTNALAGLGQTAEHGRYSTAWIRKVVAQVFVAPGPRNAFNQLRFYWNHPIDRLWLSLPRRLWFLYHIIRAPMWFARLLFRSFRVFAM